MTGKSDATEYPHAFARLPCARYQFGVPRLRRGGGTEARQCPLDPPERHIGAASGGRSRSRPRAAPEPPAQRCIGGRHDFPGSRRHGWVRAARMRPMPASVRGPVLRPPCRRQRPFRIAGCPQAAPARVRAQQPVGHVGGRPPAAPFFSRPRRLGRGSSLPTLVLRFRWMRRAVLAGGSSSRSRKRNSWTPRRTAGFPAGDVGELAWLRGAAECGERGVMGEDRLGGERGLERLLRVERAKQVDGGSPVLGPSARRCRCRRTGGHGPAHAGCRR